jgi:hypothetical protein
MQFNNSVRPKAFFGASGSCFAKAAMIGATSVFIQQVLMDNQNFSAPK